jgi:hypothetical protein
MTSSRSWTKQSCARPWTPGQPIKLQSEPIKKVERDSGLSKCLEDEYPKLLKSGKAGVMTAAKRSHGTFRPNLELLDGPPSPDQQAQNDKLTCKSVLCPNFSSKSSEKSVQ